MKFTVIFICLLFSGVAYSAVTYTHDRREYNFPLDSASPIVVHPSSDFSDFSYKLRPSDSVFVHQSSLGQNGFSAIGYSGSWSEWDDYYLHKSVFDVSFSIDRNTLFHLSGVLACTTYAYSGFQQGYCVNSLALYGGDSKDSVIIQTTDPTLIDASVSGAIYKYYNIEESVVLAQGEYRIAVVAGSSDLSYASFNVSGVFQNPASVPAPAAVWLMGSGLIGLVALKRTRN